MENLNLEITDLQCNCCNNEMRLQRHNENSGSFFCLECGQNWHFDGKEQASCKIVHRLFPSYNSLDDMPKNLMLEYLDHQLSEYIFKSTALSILGVISEMDKETLIETASNQVNVAKSEQLEKRNCKKWWQIWK